MKNLLILIIIAGVLGFSIRKGTALDRSHPRNEEPRKPTSTIPSVGRIQVLNGCGSGGSARTVAEYLRQHHFDVKNIGNAENWNFPETLVISRIADTSIAAEVAAVLETKNITLIKTSENLYDVTVIVGPDYRERMQ